MKFCRVLFPKNYQKTFFYTFHFIHTTYTHTHTEQSISSTFTVFIYTSEIELCKQEAKKNMRKKKTKTIFTGTIRNGIKREAVFLCDYSRYLKIIENTTVKRLNQTTEKKIHTLFLFNKAIPSRHQWFWFDWFTLISKPKKSAAAFCLSIHFHSAWQCVFFLRII